MDDRRGRLHGIVKDPSRAALQRPSHTFACKRRCVDRHYDDTFNRDTVQRVDLRSDPRRRLVPGGVETTGVQYRLGARLLATPGRPARAPTWGSRPPASRTCSRSPVRAVPRCSPPRVATIKQPVGRIADRVGEMQRQGIHTVEARVRAQDAWGERVNAMAAPTRHPRCEEIARNG